MNLREGFDNPKIETVLYYLALDAEQIQSSRHAAAIVNKGKILSVGTAKMKTHPMQVKYQPNKKRIYLHAEIDAIVRTINQYGSDFLKECDLYVLRLSKAGAVSMSRPCPGCTKAIEAFGIQTVYYTK